MGEGTCVGATELPVSGVCEQRRGEDLSWSVRPPGKPCLGPSSLEDLGREGLIRTSLLKHCLTKHLLKCSVTSQVLKK